MPDGTLTLKKMELDEIIYTALRADESLMSLTGGRIVSTCFEVSPYETDDTPLPCLIILDDGIQNQPESKDEEWESDEDRVQSSVEIDGRSSSEVKQLRRMVRRAVARYIGHLTDIGEQVPTLESVQSNAIAWDWMKPCYHTVLTYNCMIDRADEQDE